MAATRPTDERPSERPTDHRGRYVPDGSWPPGRGAPEPLEHQRILIFDEPLKLFSLFEGQSLCQSYWEIEVVTAVGWSLDFLEFNQISHRVFLAREATARQINLEGSGNLYSIYTIYIPCQKASDTNPKPPTGHQPARLIADTLETPNSKPSSRLPSQPWIWGHI